MKKLFRISLLISTALFLGACNAPPGTKVVMLDVAAVAKETGEDVVLQDKMASAGDKLNEKIKEFAQKLEGELAAEREKIGESPTDEQTQELNQKTIQANLKLRQGKEVAQQKAQQYQVALLQELRNRIMPIAEQVAKDRGAQIVELVSPTVIWFDPALDITADVTTIMKAQPIVEEKPSAGEAVESETGKVVEIPEAADKE